MGLWKTGVIHGTDTSSTTSTSPSNLPKPPTDSLPVAPTKPKPPGYGDSGGGGGSSETTTYTATPIIITPPTIINIPTPKEKFIARNKPSNVQLYQRAIEKKSRYKELLELKKKKKESFSFSRKQKVRVAPLIKHTRLKKIKPYTFSTYLMKDSVLGFKSKIKRRKR